MAHAQALEGLGRAGSVADVAAGVVEVAVTDHDAGGDVGDGGQAGEHMQGLHREARARPGHRENSRVHALRGVTPAEHHLLVVAAHHQGVALEQAVQTCLGIGAVADDVAGHHDPGSRCAAVDVGEDGLEGLEVRVNVGEQRDHAHAPLVVVVVLLLMVVVLVAIKRRTRRSAPSARSASAGKGSRQTKSSLTSTVATSRSQAAIESSPLARYSRMARRSPRALIQRTPGFTWLGARAEPGLVQSA
jgi:hypothetical protein